MSAAVDALSVTLPEGERFFVQSVRKFRDLTDDARLLEQIDAFAEQEAHHRREHIDYNRGLRILGYDVDAMEDKVRQLLDRSRSHPTRQLAVTCSLEHFTNIISHLVLREPEIIANVPAAYRELWLWHALEELEHTSVPYELLMAAFRDRPAYQCYIFRTMVMLRVTKALMSALYENYLSIFRVNDQKTDVKAKLRWVKKLIFYPGYLRKGLPRYLSYFIPGFHPKRFTDAHLVQYWQKKIDYFDPAT